MADISALGQLKPIEQLDLSAYKDVKETVFRLPAKGVYLLQAPESFPAQAFSRTKNGDLAAQIDPKIVDGPHAGFQLRFVKVSAKVFNRDGEKVSQLGDYLRATGFTGKLTSEQDQADAVESTANLTYRAQLDWRAYSKDGVINVQGMERFPKLEDGTYQSYIEHPTEKDENGKAVKVRANLFINRFYPAN